MLIDAGAQLLLIGASNVGLGTAWIIICWDALAVSPFAAVVSKVTLKVPELVKVWVGLGKVEKVLSPKFQR